MTMDRKIAAAERVCAAAGVADGTVDTGVARLAIARRPALSPLEAMIYEPLVCFVLQGAKDTGTQGGGVRASAGRMLVVSHDVPIVSRIVEATPHRPYIALILPLDLSILRELVPEVDGDQAGGTGRAMTLHEADDPLCDAFARLLDLVERPGEAGVLGPLVQREIHYRLLVSPQGATLRALLADGPAGRISDVIAHLRAHVAEPVRTEALARLAGMSRSTFHARFKAVTATTPLQYQKEMRLLQAREHLRLGGQSVSSVAFAVGYESPTQFSREYTRKFGAPPREDLRA
ncbi:AraC family transcriptional regulator [Roseovarius atlanticus]|uniref:AraC family transcriptional regulator n=1 Tax=Roseovarius atlanticus TaxID=1641875 RepID=UPI001C942819|nr:AraC family transcriptional regulator [Roseovarius atlanticus]MBY5986651.1 AraC family transcriptional regulator [Roseovarius atlanticus]MBY6125291.1 AraC family transcriptional regulator [Roseovarius atlanticus]MBY6150248.1 AraC family transcriptional regulator [Roseovarius atlanticus]